MCLLPSSHNLLHLFTHLTLIHVEVEQTSFNPSYSDGFFETHKCNKDCPLYILRGHKSEFPNYDVFKSLKIGLTSAKRVDLDEFCCISSWSSLFAKVLQNTKG